VFSTTQSGKACTTVKAPSDAASRDTWQHRMPSVFLSVQKIYWAIISFADCAKKNSANKDTVPTELFLDTTIFFPNFGHYD
jgi:hypothetical protein